MVGPIIKQAGKKALDMTRKARLARAKAQGFDVDNVYYHGTDKDIKDLRIGGQGATGQHGNLYGEGVYLTNDSASASSYANSAAYNNGANGETVYPLIRRGKFYDATSSDRLTQQEAKKLNDFINSNVPEGDKARIALDAGGKRKVQKFKTEQEAEEFYETQHRNWEYFDGFSRTEPEFGEGFSVEYIDFNAPVDFSGLPKKDVAAAIQRAGGGTITQIFKNSGYDGIDFTNQSVIFDPRQIRSVNAAFDPEKTDSSKLLASGAIGAAGLGALAMPEQAQAAGLTQAQIDYLDQLDQVQTTNGITPAQMAYLEQLEQDQPTAQPEIEQGPQVDRRGRSASRGPVSDPLKNVLTEAAAAINRGAVDIAEFFTTDQLNAIMELSGSDKRYSLSDIPGGVGEFIEAGQQGGQMQPGMARDIVQTAGEYIPATMGGAAALRGAVGMLPAQAAGESAAAGTLRTVAQTTAPIEIGSAIGAGTGEVIDERLGGEGVLGGVAGAILGGLTPSAAYRAGKGIANRIGLRPQDLIDEKTGLPSVELERALKKHDVTLASIMDDTDDQVVTIAGSQLKALPPPKRAEKLDNYVKRQIVKQLKQTSGKASLADKKLSPGGASYVPDDLGKRAVKAGYRPGDVTAAKTAERPTRQAMAKMLGVKRQVLEDSSAAQAEKIGLPLDVAGGEVFRQWATLRKEATKLNKRLTTLAETPAITGRTLPRVSGQGAGRTGGLKGLEIDTLPIQTQVLEGLRGFNIDIPKEVIDNPTLLKEFINSSGVFQGSSISKNRASVKVIKDAIDILSEAKVADAYDAHIAKRQLDEMIDYKRRSSNLTPSGERFVQGIRKELNKAVRKANPEYAKINDDLSAAIGAINSIVDSMPRKVDLFEEGAVRAVGKQLRKLETNYSSEQPISNALNELETVYKRFGYEPRINVKDLVTFNNTLDDRFGSSVRGGFQGQQEQGFKQFMRGVVAPKETIREKGFEIVAEKFKPTDEEALNIMQRILMRKE